jgi:hypothetical protein
LCERLVQVAKDTIRGGVLHPSRHTDVGDPCRRIERRDRPHVLGKM